MKNPIRHHYGSPTPPEPAKQYGKYTVKADLPRGILDRIPSRAAVEVAILEAPRAGDLPEPPGKCVDTFHLRLPPSVFEAFEAKRDGLARGAYLRRIIHWRWGV